MKLSFSTLGTPGYSWQEITAMAKDLGFAGIELPDVLTRTLGVLDLIAVVVLVFTSVRLKIWKKDK